MENDDDRGIDVQDFSHACAYGETLHLRTLAELFDADRKKSFLERTFAGPTIRKLFKTDKEARAIRDFAKQVTVALQPLHFADAEPAVSEAIFTNATKANEYHTVQEQ